MSENAQHIAIIGGGIVGTMCAWELSSAGCEVTIVERDRFGAACSHGNCGYISPSHVLPLAQPGAIGKTLKAMMKPNSPFAVRPRFSRDALSWFWNFARSCNHSKMLAAAAGIHPLLQSSKQLYQELIANESIDCEWESVGCLFVYESEKELDEFSANEKLIREEFGVGATRYDGDQLLELEPALKPVLAGGWHYPDDCHVRPDLLLSAMRQKLEARGVQIIENTEIQEFVIENGKAKAITSNSEDSKGSAEFSADQFVLATGAWAPMMNTHLGCRIPIQPGKGYSLTMPTPSRMPRIPIIFEDTHVAITPMKSKYRIGSTMEFVGYDTSINPQRLNLLRESAERYLVDPFCEPVEEEWFGWRPMTWDGKPVIDRSPAMNNVWICAGHSMLGLSMATASGKLMREMILEETPHLDPAPYSVSRF